MSKEIMSGDIQTALSVIKDPFGSKHIHSIFIHASINIFTDEWLYKGKVEFKNGDTKGEQSFKGESLADVITKVDAFIKELENTRHA